MKIKNVTDTRPITHWKFTARNVRVEDDHTYSNEGRVYIYDCEDSFTLVDVLKRRYPNCKIGYEHMSYSKDYRLVVSGLTISEAHDFSSHVKPDENPLLDIVYIEFEEKRFGKPMDISPKEEFSDCYHFEGFRGGSIPIPNCVWPEHTFENIETKTLKAGDVITFDYKIDDSTTYPHVDIKDADEWPDTDKMWDMFTKHYTDYPLPTGVAIVKEEKDMAGYKLKDAHNSLKLYMVEDKPIYTPRGMVRGTAHNVEELPEAIRNVQFNEKKGVVTVIWVDGKVTMAKCGPNDLWDPEKGLAIAIMKRWFKSTSSMNKWIKGIIPEGCEAESLMDQLINIFCRTDSKDQAEKSDRAEMLEKYESVKEENK